MSSSSTDEREREETPVGEAVDAAEDIVVLPGGGSDSDDESEEEDHEIMLGFLEEEGEGEGENEGNGCLSELTVGLVPGWFSYSGGRPAVLPVPKDSKRRVDGDRVRIVPNLAHHCTDCGRPMVLLVTLYAPLPAVPPAAATASPPPSLDSSFHRLLYLLRCPDNCTTTCLRLNASEDDPWKEQEGEPARLVHTTQPPATLSLSLCAICGFGGTAHCGGCKSVYYCSKEHQRLHWKLGHDKQCGKQEATTTPTSEVLSIASLGRDTPRTLLHAYLAAVLPVREIVTDVEPESEPVSASEKEKAEKLMARLAEEEAAARSTPSSTGEEPLRVPQSGELHHRTDRAFADFQSRLAWDPLQVLRYNTSLSPTLRPLWPTRPVPDCPPTCSCGTDCVFEFQVTPVLIFLMKCDTFGSMDFGSIGVWSCRASCEVGASGKGGPGWAQEVVRSVMIDRE